MLDLDAVLIANLKAGTGTPYFTVRLMEWNGAAWLAQGTYTVNKAMLSRMRYEVYVSENLVTEVDTIMGSNFAIDVERGLTVDGVKYSIVSNDYYIVDISYTEGKGTRIVGELLPSISKTW